MRWGKDVEKQRKERKQDVKFNIIIYGLSNHESPIDEGLLRNRAKI